MKKIDPILFLPIGGLLLGLLFVFVLASFTPSHHCNMCPCCDSCIKKQQKVTDLR